MTKKPYAIVLFVTLALLVTACSAPSPTAAPQEDTEEVAAEEAPAELTPLKIALLPVLDTLPLYIAQEKGYFTQAGLEVELIPTSSPVERDQLMQAGEIDGMLNEMTSTAVFNRESIQVQIVTIARAATPDGPVFRVLAAPDSGIESPAGLAGVPIGVSLNTVIEYLTVRLLESEGLSPDDIVVESVPVIPERFQLLMSGQIQAATLPDPLAQAAIEAGATPVIDDTSYPTYSVSVYSFSIKTIENNPEAVRRFVAAWDKAVADLNADPEAYRALFLEKVSVPESVQDTYRIPPFLPSQIPTEAQWDDVLAWLIDKGLIETELPYADSITADFLPTAE